MTGVGLKNFFIKQTAERPVSQAEKRAARLPTPDLITWTENAIVALGRNLDVYRNYGTIDALIEAEDDAPVVGVLLAELRKRAALAALDARP